jgi:hypothetical protein
MLTALRWYPGEHDPRCIIALFPLGLLTMGFLGVLGVVLWIIQYPLYGYLIGLGQEKRWDSSAFLGLFFGSFNTRCMDI